MDQSGERGLLVGPSLQLLLRLAHEENRCVIVVTHDLSIAAQADAVLELRDGQMQGAGEA